ncbi:hypothetical protein H8D83_01925 [Candidatus Woesearchaeota archaeon]|nr:hypothetical protein [Candidatus Woesearchaeota archaeon]MBL7051027.1 hypothetical protein [Candidatus Woesearchaeota archaeon]
MEKENEKEKENIEKIIGKPKKNYLNKTGIWKTLFAGTLIASALYVGDKLNVSDKISDSYNSAKESTVDVFTTDVGEVSQNFIDKIIETDDISKYSIDLAKVMYVTSEALPDSIATIVINKRVSEMDSKSQLNVLKNTTQDFLKKNKDGLEILMKEYYQNMKDRVYELRGK